tara:strand:- start:50 stop:196 length:147 start_codon:yes stop_codon:yes gene_type:complete
MNIETIRFKTDKEYENWIEELGGFPENTRVFIGEKEVVYFTDDEKYEI